MHSIMITSYECYGEGSSMLKKNLEAVFSQTYRPLQCIVSDHSKDNVIQDMVKTLDHKDIDFIYVHYYENYGNPCHNWRNALQYASGDTLQYMCMDERPAHPDAIKNAIHRMNANNAKWMVCAQIMEPGGPFIPSWNERLLYGANGIGGPAAAMFRSDFKNVTFDPQFNWLMDIDLYYRLYLVAGRPLIHTEPTFINTLHPNQLTHRVNTTQRRNIEMELICKKYGSPPPLCP